MPLITVEQAVQAVERVARRPDSVADFVWLSDAVDALRALPPAEPSEAEVERVARAVYTEDEVMECLTPESRVQWDALTNDWRDHWRNIARAAIAAMRKGEE